MLASETSQCFAAPRDSKCWEASIFLWFWLKNVGRPQKTQKTQSFGGLRRLYPKSERLRPLSIQGLGELQNTERPQSVLNLEPKIIEASQCFATPRVPKCWEASIFFESWTQNNWGLSVFCNSQGSEVLRGLNLVESWTLKRLGPLEVWKLPESQNAERSQFFSFWGYSPKTSKRLSLLSLLGPLSVFAFKPEKHWGLSRFWSSQSPKVLRGLNLFESWTLKRLGPLEVWKLPESQNAERSQLFSFWGYSPKTSKRLSLLSLLEPLSIFAFNSQKRWGLSRFWSSQSFKVLIGLNFFWRLEP